MKISVITSFNKHYFELIGEQSVSSWLTYWPKDIKLTCYVEEFNLPVVNHRMTEISFDQLSKEYFSFQQDPTLKARVKTFAKKAYSIIHAFENNTADRIIWLDADVISTREIPKEFLESICPNDALLAYMRVWHLKNKTKPEGEEVPSAESGVFVVNTRHPEFKNFSCRYKEYYDKRLTSGLRRFYDGEVLGAVAKEFENICKIVDMCEVTEKKYKSPLKHLPIGGFLVHHKSKHSKDQFIKN